MEGKIADKTSTGTIIGGAIAFGIILLACPPLLFLFPFVAIALVVLYFVGTTTRGKALKIANSHLSAEASKMLVDVSVGNASHLVLNDWGLVYVRPGKPAIERAWHDIKSVREPHLGILEFAARDANFEMDLCVLGYFEVVEGLNKQIRDRCHFTIDPETGESNLSNMIAAHPLKWTSRKDNFVIDATGIEYNGSRMAWTAIQSVREICEFVEEAEPNRALNFAGSFTLSVPADAVNVQNLTPRYTDFDLVRAVLKEKLGSKFISDTPPPTPAERALWQFQLMHESYEAAFSMALKTGRYQYIEKRFATMLSLIDKYRLEHDPAAREFLRNYALLLERTGRTSEAAMLESRAR